MWIKRTLSFLIVRRFTKIFITIVMFVFLLQNAKAAPFNEQDSIHSKKEDNNNLNQKEQKTPKVTGKSEKKKTVGSMEVLPGKSSQKSKSGNSGNKEKITNKKETALPGNNSINSSKVNNGKKAILNDQKDLGEAGKIFESRHEKDKKKIEENISTNKTNKSQNVNQGLFNKKPKHKNNVTKKTVNSKIILKHANIPTKPDKKLIPPPPEKG